MAKVNTLTGLWDAWPLPRSAGIDQSVLGSPIAADPSNQFIYQHEMGYDADGVAIESYFETGWTALSNGTDLTGVDWMLPDMKWETADGGSTPSTVQITFYTINYAGDTPRTYGPYSVTQSTKFVNLRIRGRFLKQRVGSGDLGSFWRMGGTRVRGFQDGRR